MKKTIKRISIIVTTASIILNVAPTYAASSDSNGKFEFKFTDLQNKICPATWLKQSTGNTYKINLWRHWDGTSKGAANTLSSKNIFGERMYDLSIGPKADSYHTFKSYGNHNVSYLRKLNRGDIMQLHAKKDSDSSDSGTLKISGRVTP